MSRLLDLDFGDTPLDPSGFADLSKWSAIVGVKDATVGDGETYEEQFGWWIDADGETIPVWFRGDHDRVLKEVFGEAATDQDAFDAGWAKVIDFWQPVGIDGWDEFHVETHGTSTTHAAIRKAKALAAMSSYGVVGHKDDALGVDWQTKFAMTRTLFTSIDSLINQGKLGR